MKSILVVDDDLDLLYCYRMMLESPKTHVHTTDDVDEAQRIVKNEKINLAILDYMMPKLKGDQLAKRIHDIDEKVKIVFVSGYSEAIEAIKKLDITIHGVFMKPIDPEIMITIAESDADDIINDSQSIPMLNMYSNI